MACERGSNMTFCGSLIQMTCDRDCDQGILELPRSFNANPVPTGFDCGCN
jgi:hypothetical protein